MELGCVCCCCWFQLIELETRDVEAVGCDGGIRTSQRPLKILAKYPQRKMALGSRTKT